MASLRGLTNVRNHMVLLSEGNHTHATLQRDYDQRLFTVNVTGYMTLGEARAKMRSEGIPYYGYYRPGSTPSVLDTRYSKGEASTLNNDVKSFIMACSEKMMQNEDNNG